MSFTLDSRCAYFGFTFAKFGSSVVLVTFKSN